LEKAEQVYTELIAPIEVRMIRTIGRIVSGPEDAADTLQQALLAVWNNLEKIIRQPNPQAYILRLCINAAYDTCRKNAPRAGMQAEMDIDAVSHAGTRTPDREAEAREEEALVIQAIRSLPRQQGQAVLLRIVHGEPFDVIAGVLECDEQTARSHVSKGKAALRNVLKNRDNQKISGIQ
jgi:RNA polymerase sigma-70 factor (ECF subfamily)